MRRFLLVTATALLATSCRPAAAPTPTHDDVAAIGNDYWEEAMRASPLWATAIGDHRYDDKLGDDSETERLRHRGVIVGLKARLDAATANAKLSDDDRISADVLGQAIDAELSTEVCKEWLWHVDQMGGPQIGFADIPTIQKIHDDKDLAAMISRFRQVKPWFEQETAKLKDGVAQGYVTAKIPLDRVLAQLDEQLATAPADSAYLIASKELPADWSDAKKADATKQLVAAVTDSVYPGLTLYRDTLRNDVLPHAREHVGVDAIPNGAACYAAHVHAETGSTKSADEIHQLGLSEVARIHGEMLALAKKHGYADVDAYWKAIRADPNEFPKSREELLAHNEALVARATAALPRAFGKLPKLPVVVHELEAFKAKDAPPAYYDPAPDDGSRPGWYYVNTYDPTHRPYWNMAALAFHEAVPGHHLQIELAHENKRIPKFQRFIGQTAFVEGWALYAEGLADELGLYADDTERMGRFGYESWRACRLVVDTGMHSQGWTRDQALDYLLANTGLTHDEAANEIDRYITWPGQALAYKIGELEIRSLRGEAQAKLGAKFDLRAFHDRLLSHGTVPLPTARRDMEAWILSQE